MKKSTGWNILVSTLTPAWPENSGTVSSKQECTAPCLDELSSSHTLRRFKHKWTSAAQDKGQQSPKNCFSSICTKCLGIKTGDHTTTRFRHHQRPPPPPPSKICTWIPKRNSSKLYQQPVTQTMPNTHISRHGPLSLYISPIQFVRSVLLCFIKLLRFTEGDEPKPTRPAQIQHECSHHPTQWYLPLLKADLRQEHGHHISTDASKCQVSSHSAIHSNGYPPLVHGQADSMYSQLKVRNWSSFHTNTEIK